LPIVAILDSAYEICARECDVYRCKYISNGATRRSCRRRVSR